MVQCYQPYNFVNGSHSKNPDIKTPLVVSFSLRVIISSPLAAFWCQGSSKDSHYNFSYPLMEACDFLFILLVSVFNFPFLSASSFWSRILHSLNSARSSGYSPNFVFINGSISGTFDSSLIIWIQNLFRLANNYSTSGCIQQVAACSGVQPSRSWIFTETPFMGQKTRGIFSTSGALCKQWYLSRSDQRGVVEPSTLL